MIDDWYDNGRFDRTWNCRCLGEGAEQLIQLPDLSAAVLDDFEQQRLTQQCTGWAVPGSWELEGILTLSSTEASSPAEPDDDGLISWDLLPPVAVALTLAILLGLGELRQRRLRR